MKKQLFIIVSVFLALGLTSCGKMGELKQDLFKVNPNPLEVKGGKIEATVDGKFPEKYFAKKAVVTVTPILKYNGKEVKGTPKTFQGESVKGNDQVIKKSQGGAFSMPVSFDYVPEMNKSELYLDFELKGAKGLIPQVKVADGLNSTARLIGLGANEISPALAPDKFQRIIKETQEADIKFLIQQANLRAGETKSAAIKDLTQTVKDVQKIENKEVNSLNVVGYASPDGAYQLNKNLAERRLDVTSGFMNSELKKMKTKVEISKNFTPEDWDGFKKLMESSSIQDKELVLRVLSMYSDPEQREREIKNISSAFTTIADQILPQLRRSRIQLVVDVIGKSDAEITKMAKESPAKLTVDELLYAATLTDNMNAKADVYQKVVDNYSSDLRGHNNLGLVKLYEGNLDEAARHFAKAQNISANNPDVNYNLGLVALNKGELDKAEQHFGKAVGTNADLNQALGSLYVLKGDYAKAKSSFGSSVSNNAALLQILNADYNGARRTLASVANPTSLTSYLGAVVGARTNDREVVYENLKSAVTKDKSMAQKALKDMEFSKFVADQTFLSILK